MRSLGAKYKNQVKTLFFTFPTFIGLLFAFLFTEPIVAQNAPPFNRYNPSYINSAKTSPFKNLQDTLSLVGQWGGGDCLTVVVRGNYAFVGNGSLLQIYNISDPLNPQIVGQVNVSSFIFGLVISGNYAYMVPGFSIINISDVTHPKLISSISIPAASGAIAIDSNYAFVGDVYGYIYFIDISDRTQPLLLNSHAFTQGEGVVSIVVVDTLLYATSSTGTVADIFNISNISSPVHILNNYSWGYRGTLARKGHYLYLGIGGGYNEFLVYDITNPIFPRYMNGSYLHSSPAGISIKDTLAFVCELSGGFEIVNISDTSNIHLLAQLPYIYNFPQSEEIGPNNVDFTSTVAYFASINGLWTVDVSKLPTVTSSSFFGTGGWFDADIVTDDSHHAFIPQLYGGLKILDVSDPTSPQLVGQYNPNELVRDVAVSNNKAYLLCDSDMVILDVSNTSSPQLIGKVAFGDTNNDNSGGYVDYGKIAVLNSTAFAARTSKHLYAIDVSNPSLPVIESYKNTNGVPIDLTIWTNYLYVDEGRWGLQVFNISTQAHPQDLGVIPDTLLGFCIQGNDLFGLTEEGFSQYRILDSLNLVLIGSCERPGGLNTGQVKTDKEFVYAAYNTSFLTIKPSDSMGPSVVYTYTNDYGCNSFAQLGNFILLGRNGNSLLVLTNNLVSEVLKTSPPPTDFTLFQNYPNPFNPSTVISYQIPRTGKVILKVYDILGREISTLLNELQGAGNHSTELNGSNLATGVYFYQLSLDGRTVTKKMELLK